MSARKSPNLLDLTPGTASVQASRPALLMQYPADLGCDGAGAAGRIPPAVAQHAVTCHGPSVVSAQITECFFGRVRLATVQFNHRAEVFVPDVVVAAPGRSILRPVTASSRQPVSLLDIPGVPEFQGGGDTRGCL